MLEKYGPQWGKSLASGFRLHYAIISYVLSNKDLKARLRIVSRIHQLIPIILLSLILSACQRRDLWVDGRTQVQRPNTSIWGFIEPTGAVAIEPKFKSGGKFQNGFAAVDFGRPVGYFDNYKAIIDRHGRAISSTLFLDPKPMVEGHSAVNKPFRSFAHPNEMMPYDGDRSTYVNRFGHVMSQSYSRCGDFCGTVAAVVQEDPPTVHYLTTQELRNGMNGITAQNGQHYVQNPGKRHIGLINKSGQYLKSIPGEVFGSSDAPMLDFSEDLLPVKKDGGVGFVNISGAFAIEPKFGSVRSFHESRCAASLLRSDKPNLWGFIDKKGKFIVPPIYSMVDDFHCGRARVQRQSKQCGFISADGLWKFDYPGEFDNCTNFSENVAAINGQMTTFVDTSGRVLFRMSAYNVGEFHSGLCRVSKILDSGKLCGYIDKRGQWVIEPQFLDAYDFSEGLAAVCIRKPKID